MTIPLVSCSAYSTLKCVFMRVIVFSQFLLLAVCVLVMYRGYKKDKLPITNVYRFIVMTMASLTCALVVVHYTFLTSHATRAVFAIVQELFRFLTNFFICYYFCRSVITSLQP